MARQKGVQVVIATIKGKDILTHLRLMFPPYKNQPVYMHSVSVDQFPHDRNTRMFKLGILCI